MSQNGKGDDPRPCFVEKDVVDKSYDRTFNKNLKLPEKITIKSKKEYKKCKKELNQLKEFKPLSFSYKAKKMKLLEKAVEEYEENSILDITSSILQQLEENK